MQYKHIILWVSVEIVGDDYCNVDSIVPNGVVNKIRASAIRGRVLMSRLQYLLYGITVV